MFQFGTVWAGMQCARKDIVEINAATQALSRAIIERDLDLVWKLWAAVSVTGRLLGQNLENMGKETDKANEEGFSVPGAKIECLHGMVLGLTSELKSDRME